MKPLKTLAIAALVGVLTLAGVKINQQHRYRQTPEYARISKLDQEAKEIYDALKKEGLLSYSINGKRVDLSLDRWTSGTYHTHYGDKLEISLDEEIIFRSKICRNGWGFFRPSEYPEGRARKLEEIELKTADGTRTYTLEEIPNKKEFEKYYETLLGQVYQEKLRLDQEASSRLNSLSKELNSGASQ